MAGRDRLWLLNALAVALLTLLGLAGEALPFDSHLKAQHDQPAGAFPVRAGGLELIPTMREVRLRPRIEEFQTTPLFADLYRLI